MSDLNPIILAPESKATAISNAAELTGFLDLISAISDGSFTPKDGNEKSQATTDGIVCAVSGLHGAAKIVIEQVEARGHSALAWDLALARAKHFRDNPKYVGYVGNEILIQMLEKSISPKVNSGNQDSCPVAHPEAASRLTSFLSFRSQLTHSETPAQLIDRLLGGSTAEEQNDAVQALIATFDDAPFASLRILKDSQLLTANGFHPASAKSVAEAAKIILNIRPTESGSPN